MNDSFPEELHKAALKVSGLMFLVRKYPSLILKDFQTERSLVKQFDISEGLEKYLTVEAEKRLEEFKSYIK